jgi:hypothetical protein
MEPNSKENGTKAQMSDKVEEPRYGQTDLCTKGTGKKAKLMAEED